MDEGTTLVLREGHTPGPWTVEAYDLVLANGLRVADCKVSGASLDETAANARLIAAAPDLLEALERLADSDFVRDAIGEGNLEAAYAAIAKARGHAQG